MFQIYKVKLQFTNLIGANKPANVSSRLMLQTSFGFSDTRVMLCKYSFCMYACQDPMMGFDLFILRKCALHLRGVGCIRGCRDSDMCKLVFCAQLSGACTPACTTMPCFKIRALLYVHSKYVHSKIRALKICALKIRALKIRALLLFNDVGCSSHPSYKLFYLTSKQAGDNKTELGEEKKQT